LENDKSAIQDKSTINPLSIIEVSVAWKIHYQLMLFVRKPRRKKTEALDLDANISSEGTQEPPLVNDAHSYPPRWYAPFRSEQRSDSKEYSPTLNQPHHDAQKPKKSPI
jgi:hypothetical protein